MSRKRAMYRSTKKRIKAIVKIVNENYMPGDQASCYKAIWRTKIYPVYGICYATFLSYIGVKPSDLTDEPETPPEDPRQLKLF